MLTQMLIAAMIAVESGPASPGGYAGQAGLIGDNGRALGVLQIHAGVVADVNRHFGTSYRHSDALDPVKAVRICRMYLHIYAPPRASMKTLARIWNGGPDGHLKQATLKYWKQVKQKLTPDAGRRTSAQHYKKEKSNAR